MSSLDRLALILIIGGIFLLAFVSGPFMVWLLMAAILGAFYGWKTAQPDLVKACCLTPPLYMLGWFANYGISAISLHTIDTQLALLDHGIGIAVWHWSALHPAVYLVLKPVYYGLGPVIIAGLCFTDRRAELVRALLIGAVAGLFCYWLFPAVGPIWVNTPHAIRNCMPSLHLTWALLLLIYCSPKTRAPMFLFAVLTTWATMGLGEHYALDLVAALPFTWAVSYSAEHVTLHKATSFDSCEASDGLV